MVSVMNCDYTSNSGPLGAILTVQVPFWLKVRAVREPAEHGDVLAFTEEVGDGEVLDRPPLRDSGERV